ncbi:MAG: SH3 domain-containing protein [Methyloceanibacter sp.]|uniref:SH3 domain-containing protein n=1 Tax=Methyloceanibacter sp. TaxID=1965321 RepID=UPI003D9AD59A
MKHPVKTAAFAAALLATSAVAASAAPAVAIVPLNVRAGPTTSAPVVGSLAPGQTVDVQGCNGGWCQVQNGYASSSYLSFGGDGYADGYAEGYYADPAYAYDDYAYGYDVPYVYPSYGWGPSWYGGGRAYNRGHYAHNGRRGGDYWRGGGGGRNVYRGGGGNKNAYRGGGGGRGGISANRGGGGCGNNGGGGGRGGRG